MQGMNFKKQRERFEVKHPEIAKKYKAKRAHAYHLKRVHGMSRATYDYLYRVQRGRCAICRRTPEEAKTAHLCVDHCHETNRTRGLLCDRCNLLLGTIRQDPSRVARLKVDTAVAQGFLDYIEHRCARALRAGPI